MYKNRQVKESNTNVSTQIDFETVEEFNRIIDSCGDCEETDSSNNSVLTGKRKRTDLVDDAGQLIEKLHTSQTNIKAFSLKETQKNSLKSIKKSIESDLKELKDQNYIFQHESEIEEKAKNFNKIFDRNISGFLSYNNIASRYDRADKLVDEYGRVFFYIPGLSDALLSNYSELKEKYSDLLNIYRNWISSLVSYEVILENGHASIVNNLGNRSFICGDTEYIDQEVYRFNTNYKKFKAQNSFHVVLDEKHKVYFSEIPNGLCKEYVSERIIENLKNTSNSAFSFGKSLTFNNLESTLLNNQLHFQQYENQGYSYITEQFNPRFLYCERVGMPSLLHRFSRKTQDVYNDIEFNNAKHCIKYILLALDQTKFNQIANEINLLSQKKILDQYNFYNQEQCQFYCKNLQLPQNQLQDTVSDNNMFWNICLSDMLYLQTDVIKKLLLSDSERKNEYINKIIDAREFLFQSIDCYFVAIQHLLTSEEIEAYRYFQQNIPKNEQEKQQEEYIFNRIERILHDTKLQDLESVQKIYYKALKDIYISVLINGDYQALDLATIHSLPAMPIKKMLNIDINIGPFIQPKIVKPDANLLQLFAYSVLKYIVDILAFEFDNSVQKITKELQQEKEFLEKEIDGLHTEVEKQFVLSSNYLLEKSVTQKCLLNPKYSIFSQDLIKLNQYIENFCNEDIQKIRKYEYIIKRLPLIDFLCKPDTPGKETLLSLEISQSIRAIIDSYLEKIKYLEKDLYTKKLRKMQCNLPYKSEERNETVSEKILRSKIIKELDIIPIEEKVDTETIFQKNEKDREKEYLHYLGAGRLKNTLLIYNGESAIDKANESKEFCDALDRTLIQPGYSYCYNRSQCNLNNQEFIEKLENSIINNDNIHIVGVNDGTADAQYTLLFISNILNSRHESGKYYTGEIFIELYNPIGIADKIAEELDNSLKDLQLKNKIVVNIINEATNKSIAVGKCFGIDFGEINKKKSSLFIQHMFLNSLNNYLGYEYPHYHKTCNEDCYYLKLKPDTWKEFKQSIWSNATITDSNVTIPTVHCMKRIAGLTKKDNISDIVQELYNNLLYDENLYKEFIKGNSGNHYTFNDIKDFLTYSPFIINQIKTLETIQSLENLKTQKAITNARTIQVETAEQMCAPD